MRQSRLTKPEIACAVKQVDQDILVKDIARVRRERGDRLAAAWEVQRAARGRAEAAEPARLNLHGEDTLGSRVFFGSAGQLSGAHTDALPRCI